MVKEINIRGRSMLFNVIFIILNLTGLVFLVIGYHENFKESVGLFRSIGYFLFLGGLAALLFFKGKMLFSYVARVIVGGLFIVSGLIKANDPLGFAYKLEEYFEDGALAYRVKELFGWETFSLEFLIDSALSLSILICILEIVLGVLVIIGGKLKLASFLMLGMMVFFTLLTWHTKECDPLATFKDVDTYALNSSAAINKMEQAKNDTTLTILSKTNTEVTIAEMKATQCVSDCGCFGDALKGSVGRSLSPSESFWKDLVLLYLVIIIFAASFKSRPNTGKENLVMVVGGTLVTIFFSYVFGWYFPILFGLVCVLGALWVYRLNNKIIGNHWGAALWAILICSLFVGYVMMYLPIKDYRPYAVGNNFLEKTEDGIKGEYANDLIYKNKNTGLLDTIYGGDFSSTDIWKDKNWEYFSTVENVIVEGKLPSIDTSEFNPNVGIDYLTDIERKMPYVAVILNKAKKQYVNVVEKSDGTQYPQLLEDFYLPDWDTTLYAIGDTIIQLDESLQEISIRKLIFEAPEVLLILSKNLSKSQFSEANLADLKIIAENAKLKGTPIAMVVNGSKEDIYNFRKKTGLEIPTFINDEKILKAVSRANPTLMVVKNGTIKAKYPHRSIPNWKWLSKNILTK